MGRNYRIVFLLVSHCWNLSALSESRIEIFGRTRSSSTPFANVQVTAGASPAAAASTLVELKRLLEEKVAGGALTEEDAQRILSDAQGTLGPLAKGVQPASYPSQATAGKANASAPTVIVVTTLAKAAPQNDDATPSTATTTSESGPAATTHAPLPSAAANANLNANAKSDFGPTSVQAFHELNGLLSHHKVGRSAEPLHRSSTGTESFAESRSAPAPQSLFGFAGEGASEIVPKDTGPIRALASLTSGVRGKALPPIAIRRAPVSGTRAPLFGSTAGAGLLETPRYRADGSAVLDFGGDDAGESGLPRGLHWLFASAMLGLIGRAAYQWRRASV